MFQHPQWMPEIIGSTKLYIYFVFLYIHTFSLKGSTLGFLFNISELPAPPLLHFGDIEKGHLNTSTVIL